jgi:hypothetical protein
MAGKGNRMKEPIVQAENEEIETVAEEKPVKKVKQRKEKPAQNRLRACWRLLKTNGRIKSSDYFCCWFPFLC